MADIKLNSIEDAVKDFQEGKFVIVVDDEDRENEGDLIIAAEKIDAEKVNFMLKNARGVLCAPITLSRCEELDLPHQVSDNTSMLGTPFTITVDKLEGCTTGVSAHDRAETIKALADPASTPQTFGRPGHINPLYAQDNGVLRRSGHTEAAIDLCRMAGLYPAGALMEIMNEDGTMARLPQLMEMAKEWNLKIISIKDMIEYRLKKESLIEVGEEVDMPTEYGHFRLIPFRQASNGLEHMALIKGEWKEDEPIHGPCTLILRHRRHSRKQAMRLRTAAAQGDADDRESRKGCSHLHAAGRPRHRIDEQDCSLQTAGRRIRYRRCQRTPRFQAR